MKTKSTDEKKHYSKQKISLQVFAQRFFAVWSINFNFYDFFTCQHQIIITLLYVRRNTVIFYIFIVKKTLTSVTKIIEMKWFVIVENVDLIYEEKLEKVSHITCLCNFMLFHYLCTYAENINLYLTIIRIWNTNFSIFFIRKFNEFIVIYQLSFSGIFCVILKWNIFQKAL